MSVLVSVHGLGVRTFANALFHKRGRALPVRGPTQQVSPARAVCRRHARKQRTELVEAQHAIRTAAKLTRQRQMLVLHHILYFGLVVTKI